MSIYRSDDQDPASMIAQCSCSATGHIVRFDYFKDDTWMYAHVGLDPAQPWYRRIWLALKYIINPKKLCNYGWGSEVVLDGEDVSKLANFLMEQESKIWTEQKKLKEAADNERRFQENTSQNITHSG